MWYNQQWRSVLELPTMLAHGCQSLRYVRGYEVLARCNVLNHWKQLLNLVPHKQLLNLVPMWTCSPLFFCQQHQDISAKMCHLWGDISVLTSVTGQLTLATGWGLVTLWTPEVGKGRKSLTNPGSGRKGRNFIIPFVDSAVFLFSPYQSNNVELK
jgi:hypothetical protein